MQRGRRARLVVPFSVQHTVLTLTSKRGQRQQSLLPWQHKVGTPHPNSASTHKIQTLWEGGEREGGEREGGEREGGEREGGEREGEKDKWQ